MDIMKKKVSCLILSVSLVACGGGGGEPASNNTNNTNTEETITSINLSTTTDLSIPIALEGTGKSE